MKVVPNVTRAVEEAINRPIGTPRLKELVSLFHMQVEFIILWTGPLFLLEYTLFNKT
jgi:hypothetical protein